MGENPPTDDLSPSLHADLTHPNLEIHAVDFQRPDVGFDAVSIHHRILDPLKDQIKGQLV